MNLPLLASPPVAAAGPSVEKQLAALARCGVRPRAGVTVADLLAELPRPELEREPYRALLHLLGSDATHGPHAGRPLSDDVWRFDLESVDQPGGFARAAARLRDLAQGELPLEDVRDHVDPETGRAWLEYRIDGAAARFEVELAGDWADLMPVLYVAEELDARGGERRFTLLEDGGRYALVGCATPQQLSRLQQVTGLEFEWFTE
jgi:hypothetical protein